MSMRRLSCCNNFHLDVENHRGENPSEKVIHNNLFNAAIRGDWKTAEKILKHNPECATHVITPRGETLLHIAAMGKSKRFVKELVSMLDKNELERLNGLGLTAFYLAVLSGVVENAKVMVEKNEKVSTILCCDCNPINAAAWNGHKKMVNHLYNTIAFDKLREKDRVDLLEATIQNDMYDVALKILEKDRSLATMEVSKENRTLLHVLAQKPLLLQVRGKIKRIFLGSFLPTSFIVVILCYISRIEVYVIFYAIILSVLLALVFLANYFPLLKEIIVFDKVLAGRLLKKIWEEYLGLPEDRCSEIIKETELLHYAAKEGNDEFAHMLLESNPNLVWLLNDDGQNIFHVAALHRKREVLNLIYKYRSFKDFISDQHDKDENSILHLAAKLKLNNATDANPEQPREPSSSNSKEAGNDMPKSLLKVPGAALQLQREILWFTEVGKILSPPQRKLRNKESKTAKQIFIEDHRRLLQEGEKWMKDTASNCMLVATLIATVMFAAAFTVPGGNNDNTGIPIFIKRSSFSAFMVSDAVAVISSSVSIIMFLSIMISSYRQDDFLVSLPLKLLVGLTSLFVSIVTMVVAFVVAYSLTFDKPWNPKHIIASIVIPFAFFLSVNFSIWLDTIKSMFLVLRIRIGSFKKVYFR